jgi:hypothetical protein
MQPAPDYQAGFLNRQYSAHESPEQHWFDSVIAVEDACVAVDTLLLLRYKHRTNDPDALS